MHSIKPGRGPSAMGAVGGVIGIVFGIFWTILVSSSMDGAPGPVRVIFPLFGLLFIGVGVVSVIYHLHNAVGKNRLSAYDVTTHAEEPDPLHRRFGPAPAQPLGAPAEAAKTTAARRRYPGDFCPFCGAKVDNEFDYCPKCGKDI